MLGSERPERVLAMIERTHATMSDAAIRRRVQEVLNVDATTELARVQVPILSVQAARDRLVPASAGKLIRRISTNVEVVGLDAPHLLLQTRAEQAAAAIKGFIRRLPASSDNNSAAGSPF